jgi:thiol-disulfide isomerase/thioredoxin
MLVLESVSICRAQMPLFEKYKSWDVTLDDAGIHGKNILLYFGASWCAPCQELTAHTFKDTSIIRLLDKDYRAYSFDLGDERARPLLEKYRITTIPLLLVIDPKGYLLDRIDEIPTRVDEFKSFVTTRSANMRVYKGISNVLDMPFPAFYRKYFEGGMKVQPDSAEVDDYLKTQRDLRSEINWDVLSLFNKNDAYYDYLVTHRKEFEELYGTEAIFKILEMYRRIAGRCMTDKDSVHFNYITRLMINTADSAGKRAYLMRQLQFLGKSHMDWNKFIETAQLYIREYGNNDNHFFCQYALTSRPSEEAVRFLLDCMEPVLEKMPTPESYYMYGTLLTYSDRTKEASVFFDKTLRSAPTEQQKEQYREKIHSLIK